MGLKHQFTDAIKKTTYTEMMFKLQSKYHKQKDHLKF